MDDRPFRRDAINRHANVQSRAVFSYAMTVMDNIYQWEEEEKWLGSKCAARMWIYTKCVLCDGQEFTQEYMKRRMLSIMPGVNRVCEEAFEEHEWVSELTISMQEGRSVGGSGLRNRYPLRGAVEHAVVLSALAVKSINSRRWQKNREVARSRELGDDSNVHSLLLEVRTRHERA